MAGPRFIALCLGLVAGPAIAEPPALTPDKVNETNNPLTPKLTAELQDTYVGSYFDLSDTRSNTLLVRGLLPFTMLLPQVLRVTLPIVTTPNHPLEATTGLGDLNLVNVFLFKAGPVELGLGPQFSFPTATDDRTGTGKWLVGAAGVAIATLRWGLLGAFVNWQHSFAGDSARPTQSVLQVQPLLTYNLGAGFYARSTAIWSFDLEQGTKLVPIGLGFGKVWLLEGGTTLNLYIEPQITAISDGISPQWQIFAGLNSQLPIGLR